ncbi:PIN-like domain-containing protein [Bacillus wiedmannii]|uniref:PIN-like domain-containing protein n=1 Tax=Bacillus wiedmannii TaxID=1890302 RepID=UPI00211D2B49|nr:PIN-like domain-containing protein [Bacillus wiedmannii]
MDKNKNLMKSDNMDLFINCLMNEKQVATSLSSKKILEICDEGQKRYHYLIPPGYMDKDKEGKRGEKQDPKKPYGDLIIWESILKKAKDEKRSIIFTTSDSKEDWWQLKAENKLIEAPRPELIAEFEDYVKGKNKMLMIPMKEFIAHYSRLNKISDFHNKIELNAEEFIEEYLLDNSSWSIESILTHDGQIQDYMKMGLFAEINDLVPEEIVVEDYNVDFDNEKINISISGNCFMTAHATIREDYSEEHRRESTYNLEMAIVFSIEINIDKDEYQLTVNYPPLNVLTDCLKWGLLG